MWRCASLLAALALLISCGSDGNLLPQPAPATKPLALTLSGVAANKFRASGDAWAVMSERLQPLMDVTAPDRRLLLSTGNGSEANLELPPGWSLIDFALHPSGEVSLVLATDTQLRLQRRARDGRLIADVSFTDAEAATDPFIGNAGTVKNAGSLVPQGTRDAVRLAPFGEDLLIAYRTGRNAIIAQLLRYIGGADFERRWRTLVEPGVPIYSVRLTSGKFDPFGSLDNQWHLLLDFYPEGQSAIARETRGDRADTGSRRILRRAARPSLGQRCHRHGSGRQWTSIECDTGRYEVRFRSARGALGR